MKKNILMALIVAGSMQLQVAMHGSATTAAAATAMAETPSAEFESTQVGAGFKIALEIASRLKTYDIGNPEESKQLLAKTTTQMSGLKLKLNDFTFRHEGWSDSDDVWGCTEADRFLAEYTKPSRQTGETLQPFNEDAGDGVYVVCSTKSEPCRLWLNVQARIKRPKTGIRTFTSTVNLLESTAPITAIAAATTAASVPTASNNQHQQKATLLSPSWQKAVAFVVGAAVVVYRYREPIRNAFQKAVAGAQKVKIARK